MCGGVGRCLGRLGSAGAGDYLQAAGGLGPASEWSRGLEVYGNTAALCGTQWQSIRTAVKVVRAARIKVRKGTFGTEVPRLAR